MGIERISPNEFKIFDLTDQAIIASIKEVLQTFKQEAVIWLDKTDGSSTVAVGVFDKDPVSGQRTSLGTLNVAGGADFDRLVVAAGFGTNLEFDVAVTVDAATFKVSAVLK